MVMDQRKHLARISKRRERNRLLFAKDRTPKPSERANERQSGAPRAWFACKMERRVTGETRSEFDRRREVERRARLD